MASVLMSRQAVRHPDALTKRALTLEEVLEAKVSYKFYLFFAKCDFTTLIKRILTAYRSSNWALGMRSTSRWWRSGDCRIFKLYSKPK